jgi:predicted transport protein
MASPEEMAQSMRTNMLEKTGKTAEEWSKVVASSSLEKHGQIVKHLKSEFSVTHGFANLIAHDFLNQGKTDEVDLVAQQYEKGKQDLKPIYDAIIQSLSDLAELEVSPKKTYVSLRRKKQFALIQPSTKTRVDIGINLKDEPTTDRLEASGGFNGMVSHRVRLTDLQQVDSELLGWLKKAFQQAV